MAKCSVILSVNDGLHLRTVLATSKFFVQLKKYYLGKGTSPDISVLKKYVIENFIPSQFGANFKPSDVLEFLNDPLNRNKLKIALDVSFGAAMAMDPLYIIPSLDYVEDSQGLIKDLILEAGNLTKSAEKGQEELKQHIEDKEVEANTPVEDVIKEQIWGSDYADLSAYRAARFKNSTAIDNLLSSRFTNEGFINNAYIDTVNKKIVNQKQEGAKASEVDLNLKAFRLKLLKKFVDKFDLYEVKPGEEKSTKIVFSEELGNRLNEIIPLIEEKVKTVTYRNQEFFLLGEGILSTLANNYSNSKDINLKVILDDYVEFLMLADFDTLLKFYIPDTLFIDYNADNFSNINRKYSINKIFSAESYNASWADKVQDGIELSSDVYKLIINSTPLLNFNTGLQTDELLYPTLVSETFSQFFNDMDRTNSINSIRFNIIERLNDNTDKFSNKDALYTIYKKFFELSTDKVKLPKNNKNTEVNSFLETIKFNNGEVLHPLMLVIVKPLQEVVKVKYAEAGMVNGKLRIIDKTIERKSGILYVVKGSISNSLNRDKEALEELFKKYSITSSANEFKLKDNEGNSEFSFNKLAGKSKYDLDFLVRLSKDLFNFDFDHNKGHKEFFNFLVDQNSSTTAINPRYISFIYDALQIINAKRMLYDDKVHQELKEGKLSNNEFLNTLVKNNTFGKFKDFTKVKLELNSASANDIYNILEEAQNKFAGNRMKSTVYTAEGTTSAGYSTYNYFLGIEQNLNKNRKAIYSIKNRDEFGNSISVLKDNPLIVDPNLFGGFSIRGAASIDGDVKSNNSQRELETATFNMDAGYFGRIADAIASETEPSPLFDITVFSDKGTNFLAAINNTFNNSGRKTDLFIKRGISNDISVVDHNKIADLLYENNSSYYLGYGQNIINTWTKLYSAVDNGSEITAELNKLNGVAAKLEYLNKANDEFWNKDGFEFNLKGLDAVRHYAGKTNTPIVNWVHFQNNSKELNNKVALSTKADLIEEIRNLESGQFAFRTKYEEMAVNYANSLLAIDYNFTPSSQGVLNTLYSGVKAKFIKEGVHSIAAKGITKISNITEIHPAILKYFYDFNLAQEIVMQASLGTMYAHKGASHSAMLITQFKRNVSATASVRLYSLGVIDGVEDETNTAVVDDFESALKTILSSEEKVVSLDGASFSTYSYRLKSWNSLNKEYGNDGGLDQKSFITSFDPITGLISQDKHAEFTMTNDLVKSSLGSDFDLYELHKDLYRGDVSKVNITKSFNKRDLSTFTDVYYYEDTPDIIKGISGNIIQLNSITYKGLSENGNSLYDIVTTDLLTTDKTTTTREINTFFDIWEILGSYKSVSVTENKTSLNLNEINFANSQTASEKLLDFEVYMGADDEVIVNWDDISIRNKADVKIYNAYKSLFNSNGIVTSHLKLVARIVNKKIKPTLEQLYEYDINPKLLSDPAIFIAATKIAYPDMKSLIDLDFNTVPSKKYQRFKGSNIDRLTTAGAKKIGQAYLNSNSTYLRSKKEDKLATLNTDGSDNIFGINKLIPTKVSNFNAGIQLNAWHTTEDSTITAPTQMLNGAIFRAFSLDEIYQVYEAIGDIVDKELTYEFSKEESADYNGSYSIPNLVKGLSNAKFYDNNKNVILSIFKGILKNKVEKEENFTLEKVILETFDSANLPIDDAHVYKAAIAELAAFFTKKGVRLDFDGLFAVLSPAAKMHQLIEVRGGFLPVRADDLQVKLIPLPTDSITALSMTDYAKWDKVKSDLIEDGQPEQAGELVTGEVRELKGQQMIITYDDGTIEDLTLGRPGKTHLLKESESLLKVKDFNGELFRAYANTGTVEELTKYHNKKIKDYAKKFKELVTNNPELTDLYNKFTAEAKNNKQDITDFVYMLFSKDYNFRKNEIQSTKDPKKLAKLLIFEYNDILNSFNRLYLSDLQKMLDEVSRGNYPSYLSEYSDSIGKKIKSVNISRAEIIAPVTMKNAFMLREGDSIHEINEQFFNDRLNDKLDIYDVDADEVFVINNNQRIFFRPKTKKKIGPLSNFVKKIGDKNWFINQAGNRLFEVPKGIVLTVENGQIIAYYDEPSKVLNFYNNIRTKLQTKVKTIKLGNAETRALAKNKIIEINQDKAKQMFVSWTKYLEVIGTRIPGQHFQSFQGLKIVGFTEGNKVYVPDEVTLLSGSDFDIDKQSLIYYSISDGVIPLWHPAGNLSSKEDLELSLKLPMPSNRPETYFIAEKDPAGVRYIDKTFNYSDDNVDNISLVELLSIYKNLENGFKLTIEDNPNLINLLLEYEVQVVTDLKAIKNFIISKFNGALDNTANFLLLSNPVSFNDIGLYADISDKAEAAKTLVRQSPFTVLRQRIANMIGKEVIGIMASSGLKSLSALTLFHNNKIKNNESKLAKYTILLNSFYEYLDENKEVENLSAIEDFNATVNERDLSRMKTILAFHDAKNSDFTTITKQFISKIDELLADGALDFAGDINATELGDIAYSLANIYLNKTEFTKSLLKRYYRNRLPVDTIDNKILSYVNYGELDVADLISQILSAATDNAKELKLDKLNASPELAGIYSGITMFNGSFEKAYFDLTDPHMEFMLSRAVKNVYQSNTRNNSINSFITILKGIVGTNDRGAYVKEKPNKTLNENYKVNVTLNAANKPIVTDIKSGNVFEYDKLLSYEPYLKLNSEITLLGKYLGINQGVKSNDWELYNFTYSLENFAKQNKVDFNMKEFLDSVALNGDYHKKMEFGAINIPQVLIANPHFIKQLTAYNVVNTMLNLSSYKIKSAYAITEKLRKIGYLSTSRSLNKNQFKEVTKFIENTVLSNFIENESNTVREPIFFAKSGEVLSIRTDNDRLKFINWFNDEFVPHLKDSTTMPELRGNDFINSLEKHSKFDKLLNNEYSFTQLMMDTTNVKSNTQSNYRDSYLYNLSLIYKNEYKDRLRPDEENKRNNIFDVLFWYNFIVNKNNISKNSYAKFLGEIMIVDAKDNVYKRLLNHISNIGKNDVELDNQRFNVTSNGVDFNLLALGHYGIEEAITVIPAYVSGDEDQMYDDDNWGNSEPDDLDPGVSDFDETQDFIDDDIIDEEGVDDDGEPIPVVQFKYERKKGLRGTENTTYRIYTITYLKGSTPFETEIMRGTTNQIGSVLMDPNVFRNKSSVINKFTNQDEKEDFNDSLNYNRLSTMSIHDLLSKLTGSVEVEIIQTDSENQKIISKFDPNETYQCS